MKKLYSQKHDAWTKIARPLYKTLSRNLAEDQIAEFYIGFEKYAQDENRTIKDIISDMCSMAKLVESETFLEDLNKNTNESGDVDWRNLLDLYKSEEDVKVVYRN